MNLSHYIVGYERTFIDTAESSSQASSLDESLVSR